MKIALRVLLALALAVTAATVYAGETGSVSGVVKDGTGQPVPGATVRVAGSQAPRTAVSGANGGFNFPVLLPGNYTVTAELKGLGIASQKVLVLVDGDAQLTLTLVQTATAQVVVTGVSSEIDKKASEVNFNYTSETIKDLPLSRTYEGLLKMTPGAPATDGSGFVSVSGGTRQDNKYLLDGVNITNPGYGFLGINTNSLDIADFNVKKAGISAEFGRTSGAIFNAVTKSGTNDLRGNLQFNASPASFGAEKKYETQREVAAYDGAASLGFPIFRDVLFGYVSGRYSWSTTSNQSATVGGVTTALPDTKANSGDYFGKLTAFIGHSFLVSAGFRALPNDTTDQFDSIYDAASAAYGAKTTNYLGNITGDWFATRNTYVEAKYVYLSEDDTSGANNLISTQPKTIDPKNLPAYGAYYDPAFNGGNRGVYGFVQTGDTYTRSEVKATISQFLDLGPTQNQFKIGGGYENIAYNTIRQTNGWGEFSSSRFTCPASACGTTQTSTIRTRFYSSQPEQVSKARTYSFFAQDTLTWGPVSAVLGVLINKDDFAQICPAGQVCGSSTAPPATTTTRYNFMTFPWSKEVQPRFGLVWNTNLLKGDKVYSSYGEYAGVEQKSTARSFAPYRIRQDQAYFSSTTGAYLGQEYRGSSSGKVIPQDLQPPYQQEFVVGYSAPITKEFAFDLYYQYRNLKNVFEDVPYDRNDYNNNYWAMNLPWARRVYRALTLDLQKRYSNGWYADVNVTWSKLYGNFDEDYGIALFNTSSLLEDDPTTDSWDANRYGRLGQDRPVILKVMGSYDFPFGLTFGAFFRLQSGTPWEPRGAGPNSTSSRYLLPAGTYRLPTWTTFDLLGAYNFKLGGEMGLRLEARLQNVFNDQTVLGINRIQYNDSYVDGKPPSQMGPQGTKSPNPLYQQATTWAAPRRLVMTAILNF
jgi:hypothetical protein